MRFYNIINENDFESLTIQEKIKILIDLDVFSAIKPNDFNNVQNDINNKNRTIDFSFLNHEVIYSGERFYLSVEFLNEVFERYGVLFADLFAKNLTFLKIFDSQLFYYPENDLMELKSKLLREKRSSLFDGLFFELNETCGYDDYENQLIVLRKFLTYDLYGLYMYLVGNFSHLYYLDEIYSKFIQIESKLYSIDNYDQSRFNDIRQSIPKKIALLENLGFFGLNSIKNKSDSDKYKIIAYLFDVSFSNTNKVDSIRRNYKTLYSDSQDSSTKFTAHKHVNTILREILE